MKNTTSLKLNKEFLRVYKRGSFFVGKHIILYVLPNKLQIKRLGITASKKIGNAVVRNRYRRIIKENYAQFEEFIFNKFDYVFVSRKSENLPNFKDIKKEMKFLLKKLNVFDKEKWDAQKIDNSTD